MVRSASEAVKAALATSTNVPGTCQLATRTWLGAPSVGDVDGDGRADAEDGWKSEPVSARHTDRRPPAGAPVAWSGGSHDDGHRALSLGPIGGTYMIRTTDGNGEGRVATRPLSWVEQQWGLTYLGWTSTISGQPIPGLLKQPEPVKPPKPKPPRLGVIAARARALLAIRSARLAARYALIAAARLSKSKDPALRAGAAEFTAGATDLTRASDRISRARIKMPQR